MIRIGTRKSKLAIWQANMIKKKFNHLNLKSDLVLIDSLGDKILDKPIKLIGGKGLFTKELDKALLKNEIDIAVHSYKDVPTEINENITVCSVMKRGNPYDALVYKSKSNKVNFKEFKGVATGSSRRKAQWLYRFNNHKIFPLRGNVDTRVKKLNLNSWDGAIFAAAGIERLNFSNLNYQILNWMTPCPAQGSIAIMCNRNNSNIISICQKFNDEETMICNTIERDFLKNLNGGCSSPIGGLAKIKNNTIEFNGEVLDEFGQKKMSINLKAKYDKYSSLGIDASKKLINQGVMSLITKK